MKRFAILGVLILACVSMIAAPALAQPTCVVIGSAPSARTDAKLTWDASTWAGPTPVGAVVTYTVYRGTVAQCVTTATGVRLSAQPVGVNVYTVTAKSPQSEPPNVESAPSNTATKTVNAPSTVNPPSNLQAILDAIAKLLRRLFGHFA